MTWQSLQEGQDTLVRSNLNWDLQSLGVRSPKDSQKMAQNTIFGNIWYSHIVNSVSKDSLILCFNNEPGNKFVWLVYGKNWIMVDVREH